MGKNYRLILLTLSTIVLLFVGRIITGSYGFLYTDFWFTTGLLMLILLSLVDQPFFSKDSNIFGNAVTAALSLLLVPKNERDVFFWVFTILSIYLVVSSYVLMWVRKSKLVEEKTVVQIISRVNRQLGRPEVLFSAFFVWGGIKQFGMNSQGFNALLWFWIVFMILNIPALANGIEGVFKKTKKNSQGKVVGEIFGVQSQNTFLIKMLPERKVSINTFDFVEFEYSIDKRKRKGLVVDVYLLDQEQWIKVLYTKEIEKLCNDSYNKGVPDVVYKCDVPDDTEILKKFVGIVAKNSTINRIRFIFNSQLEISEGQLVELSSNNKKILYQVIQGITKVENLENKNETGFIEGEAIQLGLWNAEGGSFEQFGWVPSINTPIFLASEISDPGIEKQEYVIGNIPDTNYPVILNKDIAITHHMAILGVTGCGKSVFARNLIREIACDETRVIIVDLTGEYKLHFSGINSVVDEENAKKAFSAIENIAKEKAKYLNQQNKDTIDSNEKIIKGAFYAPIKSFLESDQKEVIFEIPDISNSADVLEYTKWFFWVLFQTAKVKNNFGKRVCVVLEEAHTVVPEMNSMGVSDFASKATVNSIAQIALQGRKYNIGFIVIAQRTANVSKTILTQCNTIIAFKSLDKTSGDFLSNYIGVDLVEALAGLKQRTAIAAGKALRSTTPMIFEVPVIQETAYHDEEEK